MKRKKIKRKTRPERPPTPSPDVFEQALNTKAFGKYKTKTFRYVIEHDLAWLHWIYRQKLTQADMRSPGDLKIMLLCRHYPMGLGDAAERELAAGIIPQPVPLAEEEEEEDDDTDESEEMDDDIPEMPGWIKKRRCAFAEGYTPEDVSAHLCVIAKYVNLPLAVVWDKYENGSCGGNSEIVLIAADQYARPCPTVIQEFLMDDTGELKLRRNMTVDWNQLPIVGSVTPIKINKFNYVWRNLDSEQAAENLVKEADQQLTETKADHEDLRRHDALGLND